MTVKISDLMIKRALKVLEESGLLPYGEFGCEKLVVKKMLEAALAHSQVEPESK